MKWWSCHCIATETYSLQSETVNISNAPLKVHPVIILMETDIVNIKQIYTAFERIAVVLSTEHDLCVRFHGRGKMSVNKTLNIGGSDMFVLRGVITEMGVSCGCR